MTGCEQTATTTCVSVPTPGLHQIHVNYNGRGTQGNDVVIVGLVVILVVLIAAMITYCSRPNSHS